MKKALKSRLGVGFVLGTALSVLSNVGIGRTTCGVLVQAGGNEAGKPLMAADTGGKWVAVASQQAGSAVLGFELPPEENPELWRFIGEKRKPSYEIAGLQGAVVSAITMSRRDENRDLWLAVGYSNGRVRVFDGETGKFRYELLKNQNAVTHLKFTPAAKLLFTAYGVKGYLWKRDELVRTLHPVGGNGLVTTSMIETAQFARNVPRLLTFSGDGSGMRWSLRSIHEDLRPRALSGGMLKGNSEKVTCSMIHGQLDKVVTGTEAGSVFYWEGYHGDIGGKRLRGGSRSKVTSLDLSLNGNLVVGGRDDGSAQVWELRGKRIVGRIVAAGKGERGAGVVKIYFMNNARRVISAHKDGVVRIWRMAPEGDEKKLPLENEFKPSVGEIVDMTMLTDEKVVVASQDGNVYWGSIPGVK